MRNFFDKTRCVCILLSVFALLSCDKNQDNYPYPDDEYGVFILNTEGGDLGRLIATYDIINYPYIGVEGTLELKDFQMLKYFQRTLMYLNLEKAHIRACNSDSTGFVEANTLHQYHLSSNGITPFLLLKTVILPRKLKVIGDKAFYGSTVSDLTIYNNVEEIKASAFENCIRLSEINLPRSVAKIGENAFKGCISLTNVVLPSCVKEIYVNSFDSRYVKALHMQSKTPPALKTSIALETRSSSNSISMPTIYVPKGAKANYEAHPEWNRCVIIEK